MKNYLYRVVITEYPAGGYAKYGTFPEDPDWKPEGWAADDEWISRFRTADFFWPSTDHDYKSRSGAHARLKLIESYGAKAKVIRSNEITWPES